MTSFRNRFWGVKHISPSHHAVSNPEEYGQQIEPYLNWRLIALELNAILLCSSNADNSEMVILEGDLMHQWLKHRHSQTSPNNAYTA